MSITLTPPAKPKGLLKWFFLVPRYLYRWHLGWLLGPHCLMITHIGRKTGRKRQTVVEAVNYDPKTQSCFAVAGYGEQTDWYRNILVHPPLEIQVGNKRYVPQMRLLSSEELLTLLQKYENRHPHGFRILMRRLGYPYDGSLEALRAIAQVLRAVEFRPQTGKDV